MRSKRAETDLFWLWRVLQELCRVGDANDGRIHVGLEFPQRLFGLIRVQDGRSGHAKDLWAFLVFEALVFAHDHVVRVVLSRVMAFIKDEEGHFRDLPDGMGDEIVEDLG